MGYTRGSGLGFAARLVRPGELGQGGDSAFRPREARWRTGNGQRFKGFRAKRELFFEASGRSGASLCAGGCRGEPPCPPPAKPTPHNLTALDCAGTPGVFLSFVGTNSSPRFPSPFSLTGRPAGAARSKTPAGFLFLPTQKKQSSMPIIKEYIKLSIT